MCILVGDVGVRISWSRTLFCGAGFLILGVHEMRTTAAAADPHLGGSRRERDMGAGLSYVQGSQVCVVGVRISWSGTWFRGAGFLPLWSMKCARAGEHFLRTRLDKTRRATHHGVMLSCKRERLGPALAYMGSTISYEMMLSCYARASKSKRHHK